MVPQEAKRRPKEAKMGPPENRGMFTWTGKTALRSFLRTLEGS